MKKEKEAALTPEQENDKAAKPEKKKNTKKRRLNAKRLRYGSVATVITVVFLAVIVLVNVVVGALMDRYPLKLDLTSDKVYEISDESVEYLKSIDTDVQIIVMADYETYFTTNSYMKILAETLDKFVQYSDNHISLEYVDLTENPDYISKYSSMYSGEFAQGDVAIVRDDRIRVISFDDIFESSTSYSADYTSYTTSYTFKGEQSLISALVAITDANPMTVAMIASYNGESIYHQYCAYSVQMFQNLLEKNGYTVEQVDLMSDSLDPEVYNLAVLPAPMNDLSDSSIEKLSAFLENNGSLGRDLIYVADVYQYATPNLDAFLEIWGIEIGDSIIYESDSSLSQYVSTALGTLSAPIASLSQSEDALVYSEGLSNTKLPIVVPYGRPINLLFEANTDRRTLALLETSATAFAYPLELNTAEEASEAAEAGTEATEATEFDIESAEKQSFTMMSVSTKAFTEGEDTFTSRIMCLSSTMLLDYYVAQNSSYNNAEYVVNAINVMEGKSNGIIVADKELGAETITVTESQVNLLRNLVVGIIPLFVIACGIVVFVRRRNR